MLSRKMNKQTLSTRKPSMKREHAGLTRDNKEFSLSPSTPADYILSLQETIGNRAVQGLLESGFIKAKLKIGQPGDIYEQEADRVADAVMRMPEPQGPATEEDKEETLQAELMAKETSSNIQRQTSLGQKSIQNMPSHGQIQPILQRQNELEEEKEVYRKAEEAEENEEEKLQVTPAIRLKEEDEETEEEPLIQTKRRSSAEYETNPDLEASIRSMKIGGQPLPESVRAFFEPRFGQDFSQVRVHTGPKAIESARTLNARAYTLGRDIIFGAGQYAPATSRGQRLLAHELTHVVQQKAIPPIRSCLVRPLHREGLRASQNSPESIQPIKSPTDNIVFLQTTMGDQAVHMLLKFYAPVNEIQTSIVQMAPQVKNPMIGGVTSSTSPPYTIQDLQNKLCSLNLGPIKGADLIRDLNKANWKIFFWNLQYRGTGVLTNRGFTDHSTNTILLPPKDSFWRNVNCLFHEGMHATRPIPGARGSATNLKVVWANLEEEIMVCYQEILFIKANASVIPDLAQHSGYSDWQRSDWQRIEKMSKGQLYNYVRDELVPIIILGKSGEYKHLLSQYSNDIYKIMTSPKMTDILNRVILGMKPAKLLPPKKQSVPKKFKLPTRKDFKKEIIESAENLP